MRQIIPILVIVALAGCGADTMSAAATAAALKKQEIEQGKKTMEQMQQKIGQAMKQEEQRAQQAGDAPAN
jgi:hypothetical protein